MVVTEYHREDGTLIAQVQHTDGNPPVIPHTWDRLQLNIQSVSTDWRVKDISYIVVFSEGVTPTTVIDITLETE